MAKAAAHLCSFSYIDGLSTTLIVLIITQVVAVRGGAGKHRAFQVLAMAGAAGIGIRFVEILVLEVPRPAVDVMHAVGAVEGKWQAGMTDAALGDGARMALQLVGRDVVIGSGHGIRPDGVGRAVTAFAGDTAVTETVAIERIGVFSEALVTGQARCGDIDMITPGLIQTDGTVILDSISRMTGLASRLVQPGLARAAAHGQHTAMAIDAVDTGATHGAPEAFGDLARVALVTGFLECSMRREQRCAS